MADSFSAVLLDVMDLLGLGALGLVAAEWLALGWLSRVDWPATPAPSLPGSRWALRLLVGCVLMSLAQLVLASAGIGFDSFSLVLGFAAIGAAALRLAGGRQSRDDQPVPLSLKERVGWLVLGAILLAATVRAVVVPEAGWDAYSHWGLRARAFAVAGTIVNAQSEHEYYPPLVPLLEAWLYLNRGGVSIDLAKTVWALVGSAFGACLASHLRLSVRLPWLAPWLAAAIVVSTAMLLEGFWTGQADLALTAFLTLATLAVVQWQRSTDRAWLLQAAVFGAAATLTKFEGLPRVGVVAVALVLEAAWSRSKNGFVPALVLLAAASAAWGLWTAFQLTHAIPANAEHLGPFQALGIGTMALSLLAVFSGVRTGGAVLVAVLSYAVAGRQLFSGPLRLVSLVVVGQVAVTLIAFLLGGSGPDVAVRTSATRLFAQFLPLALFAAAVGLTDIVRSGSYNRRGR